MFKDADLIDFGAGTGENTIFLANWGARCTLVEMNRKAQDISRKVFEEYAIEPSAHHFIESSIFDYEPLERKLYDIVHCRGVLSHTAAKELAFSKISRFVKPGGYLIYGDSLTFKIIVGGCLTMVGVTIITFSDRKSWNRARRCCRPRRS